MEILKPEQYPEYDAFVRGHKNGSFTQGINWADVKKQWKHEVVVSRDSSGAIKGGMLILIRRMPLFGYSMMYAPRGPVFDYEDMDTLNDLIAGAKAVSDKYKGYSLLCDPYILADDDKLIEAFQKAGFGFKPNQKFGHTIQARENYMLTDFDKLTKDTLLSHMGSKTAYKMRYGKKKGVQCLVGGSDKIEDFMAVYKSSAGRQSFNVRSAEYLKNFLDSLGDDARLYLCYYDGQPLAGGISVNYAGRLCHVYGGSSDVHRELRATYLLQWEMMNWALETGCRIYDMQGIVTDEKENPALYGVYEFKKSFNGEVVTFAGEFDYPFRPFGKWLVETALNVRSTLRHLKK